MADNTVDAKAESGRVVGAERGSTGRTSGGAERGLLGKRQRAWMRRAGSLAPAFRDDENVSLVPATFDAAAFKAAWKRRARELGISTVEGPSIYDVVRVLAARDKAARRQWTWDWKHYEPLPFGEWMGGRDEWENERWEAIEAEARRRQRLSAETPMIVDDEDGTVPMDIWSVREIWAEVKHELAHELTLRQWRMIQNVDI